MDRFDCQLLMATFSNVYYHTFCRSAMLHFASPCSSTNLLTPCMESVNSLYIPSLCRGPNPNQVWHSILLLTTEEQLDLLSRLQESLTLRGSI